MPPELPPADSPVARSSGGPSPLGYGLLLTLAVVLFLGVAVALSWWAQRRGREIPPGGRPGSERGGAAAGGRRPGAPRDRAGSSRARSPPPASAPGPGALPSPAAAPADPAAAAAPGPPAAGPLRVVLEFSEDCWVEFVVDGRRRTSELRTSGEVVNVEADSTVLLTLGNVPGVRVEVDGRPFPLPANATRVVRDLRIDREAVSRLAGSGPATP